MKTSHTLRNLILFALLVAFAFPFVWMLFASFKSGNRAIFTPFPILPETWTTEGYLNLFNSDRIPFLRQFANTLFIALSQAVGAVILSVLMGYLFGRYRFRGRLFLFALVLLTVLLPRQVMLMPIIVWLNKLHLLDTPFAVILPGILSGLGIIYFTQVFSRIPQEIVDSARTEGASETRILHLLLPLISPAILTYGLIHFILAWNEHLIPMITLDSPTQMTLSLGLASLHGAEMHTPYNQIMAGSVMALFPTVLLFILLRRQFNTALSDLTSQ